jgi:hypothetical protein
MIGWPNLRHLVPEVWFVKALPSRVDNVSQGQAASRGYDYEEIVAYSGYVGVGLFWNHLAVGKGARLGDRLWNDGIDRCIGDGNEQLHNRVRRVVTVHAPGSLDEAAQVSEANWPAGIDGT